MRRNGAAGRRSKNETGAQEGRGRFLRETSRRIGPGPGQGRGLSEQGLGPIGFLLVCNIVLLVAGNFMEPSSIVLILAPILFPVAMKVGIDPVHFGITIAQTPAPETCGRSGTTGPPCRRERTRPWTPSKA